MLDAKLVIVGGDELDQQYLLSMPTTIGRGNENDITLPHPLVSRKHCRLYERGGVLRVRDLNSLNGTFVGRDRITDQAIHPGELLTVGTVTFRAIYAGYDEYSVLDEPAELYPDRATAHGNAAESVTIIGAPLGGLLRADSAGNLPMLGPQAEVETVRVRSRTKTAAPSLNRKKR